MGVDYLWNYYTIDNKPLAEIDLDAHANKLRDAVAAASDDAICDSYVENTSDPDPDITWIREALTEAIDMLTGWRRDTNIATIGGTTIIHSGGMSWGDNPTEAFDLITYLHVAAELARL